MPPFSIHLVLLIVAVVAITMSAAATAIHRRERPWQVVHTLRLVMIGAFTVGTCTHVENTWRAGYLPLPGQPFGLNLYWTALTLLHPSSLGCME